MVCSLLVLALLPGQAEAEPATLVVTLPVDARLFVDGNPTTSTGSSRLLYTPALETDQKYGYTLRAEIVRDGNLLVEEKEIAVSGGQRTPVRFFATLMGAATTRDSNYGNSGTGSGTSGTGNGSSGTGNGSSGSGSGSSATGNAGTGSGNSGQGGAGGGLPPAPGGGYIAQKFKSYVVTDPNTGQRYVQTYRVNPDGTLTPVRSSQGSTQNQKSAPNRKGSSSRGKR